MNRVEFQRWLDQFPEDTEIEVMLQAPDEPWDTGDVESGPFDANNKYHFEYVDLTGNKLIKPSNNYYNKRFLTLGGKE